MDKAHKATDKRLEVMERELAAIYREAQKDISDKAAAYFDQFIKQDEKKKALVADGKLSEDEYLQWRKNKILYSKRFVTLQGQITGELARVNQTAAAYINDQLPDVYALNYNYVGKGVQRAVKGYSFTLIDANTVKRLATKTDRLLPKRKVDVPKDKLWNAKNMRAQVLQGILQGESIPDISKRVFGEIMKKSKTEGLTDKEMGALLKRNREAAVRSARTMVTGAENAGRIDMMHKAATDGVIMRKRWIATTDSRTRDWHRDLDGVEVDMDEPFQNDFGDIMFPGDPTADGANVYNCRCTLGYRVVGFGNAQVQEAMAEKQVEATQPQLWENLPDNVTDRATEIDKLLTEETGKKSVFNGKVVVDDSIKFNGTANYDGSITLRSNASRKTEIHELLHQHSEGGQNKVYVSIFKNIEEGSVELLAQEICHAKGIKIGQFDYSYTPYVDALRQINKLSGAYKTDYDFAKEVFGKPLEKRAEFLKSLGDTVAKDEKRFFRGALKTLGVK